MTLELIGIDDSVYSLRSRCGFSYQHQYFPSMEHFLAFKKAGSQVPEDFFTSLDPQYASDVARAIAHPAHYEARMKEWLLEGHLARIMSHLWLYEESFIKDINITIGYTSKDCVLGTGMAPYGRAVADTEQWKGLNLYGVTLSNVMRELPLYGYVDHNVIQSAKGMLDSIVLVLNDKTSTPEYKKHVLIDQGLKFYADKDLESLGYPTLPAIKGLKEAQDVWLPWITEISDNLHLYLPNLNHKDEQHYGL